MIGAARLTTLLVATFTALSAHPLDRAAEDAGRAVITGQIEAFKRDDAAAAYGHASPSIQRLFPSEDIFIAMVRQSYRPVYRPRTFEFGPARDAPEGFEQALRIQDDQGVDWDAIYTLERQPDGSWKISGCRLVRRPGEAV